MRGIRYLVAGVLIVAANSVLAGDVMLNGQLFTIPDGLVIEQVADPTLVERPICADFDEQGRLYVADSSGSNAPVAEQLQQRPHRIVCLEDTNGDGRFDQSTVFADRMMFPEGVLWHRGSLYVAAPPSIWKLTDTDGDGVADQREEWFEGKTLTGCANDLHGPYLGLDGWIYWCKGAFAQQTYERPGKPPLVTRAAHLFRRHPTKGWIEPVMTGGMDNPVEIAFSRAGERFFTTTFLQHPGGGKRDGIIHAVYGGVYGKVHEVLQGHPRTGDIMPVMTHLGPAAPCGLTRLESDGLNSSYRDNLLACSFNMHKVTRHDLQTSGATFITEDHDWLVSDNVDFHPTDVLEDADGSVLVIDTGGWYKICCPTSHLYKPDVLGAIYRIRRADAAEVNDPRGNALDWSASPSALAQRLLDNRWTVRKRAIAALADHGAAAVLPLRQLLNSTEDPVARNEAVWALARIDHPTARTVLRTVVSDRSEIVRGAAIHALGLWQDAESINVLCDVFRDGTMADKRAAAEALGRIGDGRAIPYLIAATSLDNDRVLEHSLIYALIEIGDAEALWSMYRNPDPAVQTRLKEAGPAATRALVLAIDQILAEQDARLRPELRALLDSGQPLLRETALWLADQHPEWAGELAGYFLERLFGPRLNEQQLSELERQLSRFIQHGEIQALLGPIVVSPKAPVELRRLALHVMGQARLQELPESWVRAIAAVLESNDAQLLSSVLAVLRDMRSRNTNAPEFREPLLRIASNEELDATIRVNSLAALPVTDVLPPSLASFVIEQLTSDGPIEVRLRSADVLATAQLDQSEFERVIAAIPSVGPMELGRVMPIFAEQTSDELGLSLLAALRQNSSLRGVPLPTLKANLANFGPRVQREAARLYADLDAEAASQQQLFEQLLATLEDGDVRRGQALFYGRKAACSSCHAIGYLGGDIGPDLTRIAQIRTPRDLLEAIVFPSASFVRSYEPVAVVTVDGQVHNGVLRNDEPDAITVATAADKFVTIARDEIDIVQPSKVSVMPAGLDKQLTRQELADLLAFLKACK